MTRRETPKAESVARTEKFIICRTNQNGTRTFDSAKGGWTTDPQKAKTFESATAAKFACRHSWDKPVKLSAALKTGA